jgi:hypothetical protein
MVRLIVLPFRLLLLPFRVAAVSGRVGWHAGRAVGLSRAAFFGLGFGAGLLVASPKAREAALAGTRKAIDAVAEATDDGPPPVVEPVPDVAMVAPHGVAVADPAPVAPESPPRVVPPTE